MSDVKKIHKANEFDPSKYSHTDIFPAFGYLLIAYYRPLYQKLIVETVKGRTEHTTLFKFKRTESEKSSGKREIETVLYAQVYVSKNSYRIVVRSFVNGKEMSSERSPTFKSYSELNAHVFHFVTHGRYVKKAKEEPKRKLRVIKDAKTKRRIWKR